MYSWLWRALPGPAWFRAIVLLAAAAAIVWVLFEYAFPALAPMLPLDETTVG